MSELRIVVPMVPPSGNHYKTYRVITSRGRSFVQWYHKPAAEEWWAQVAIAADGRQLLADEYEIHFIVYRETLRNVDVDNYTKCIFDGLTRAGVIPDDKFVTDFHGHRRLDRAKPRTVILIRAAQEQLFMDEKQTEKGNK